MLRFLKLEMCPGNAPTVAKIAYSHKQKHEQRAITLEATR